MIGDLGSGEGGVRSGSVAVGRQREGSEGSR